MLVHCRRPAMATWFEIWIAGDNEEHLDAIGAAALDEVARIEGVLSRFNPASELARVNREAAGRPVLASIELAAILADCRRRWTATEGAFDVRVTTRAGDPRACLRPFAEEIILDTEARTIRFASTESALDLGGYGKGYALDQAAVVLRRFGVVSALMHGGTSSVLALGVGEQGQAWPVGVRDPFADDPERAFARIHLADAGLSSSAVFAPGATVSDLVDPRDGRRLAESAACTVIAPTALDGEVFSTALLAMGRERTTAFCERLPPAWHVAWIDRPEGVPRLIWLTSPPGTKEEKGHDKPA